jgi:hypothetical protein
MIGISALKGRHILAQGNAASSREALGVDATKTVSPERAAYEPGCRFDRDESSIAPYYYQQSTVDLNFKSRILNIEY